MAKHRTNELKGCFRKKRFRSKDQANIVARNWEQRVYECPECKGYHLTNQAEHGVVEIKEAEYEGGQHDRL